MAEMLPIQALDSVAKERPRFDLSFDLVGEVLERYGEADLAERFYLDIPPDRPWQDVADVLNILSWITSDNGAAIMRAAEHWLQNPTDLRRVQIALNLEAYPFLDCEEMELVLTKVATQFPPVAERCKELIESRRRAPEHGHSTPLQRTGAVGILSQMREWFGRGRGQ